MPRIGCDVHGRGLRVETLEEVGEREGRAAILAPDNRRDALAHRGERIPVKRQVAVAVAMCVDESRCERQSCRIDDVDVDLDAVGGLRFVDRGDGVPFDMNVHQAGGAPAAVENGRPHDGEPCGRFFRGSWGTGNNEQTHDEQ